MEATSNIMYYSCKKLQIEAIIMNIPLFQKSKIDTTSFVFSPTIILSSQERLSLWSLGDAEPLKGEGMEKVIVISQYIIIYAGTVENYIKRGPNPGKSQCEHLTACNWAVPLNIPNQLSNFLLYETSLKFVPNGMSNGNGPAALCSTMEYHVTWHIFSSAHLTLDT